jgi:two-component system response regulator YesN
MTTLMLVDDESAVRNGMIASLDWEAEGYRFAALCANGREALEAMRGGCPDILLTDIRMPVMDGIALIEAVKKQRLPMKIIILTCHAEFEYAQKAIELGVDGYILKLSATPLDILQKICAVRDKEAGKAIPLGTLRPPPTTQTAPFSAVFPEQRSIIAKIKQAIDVNYRMDLSLEFFSKNIGMSYSYLSTLFKAETGNAFKDCLNSVRIEKAKAILRCSPVSIGEAAEAVGYANQYYFSKVFKRYTGLTPLDYKTKFYQGEISKPGDAMPVHSPPP